jgi:1-acyl-sn-glycerol-3-phosphate acyltransferase
LSLIRGALCWLAFVVLGTTGLAAMLVTPGVERRRNIARLIAQAVLWVGGIPLTVHGEHALPAGGCVVVANHTSYIDGAVLTAALPPRFVFVVKSEMSRVPLAGLLLHRIGTAFVDRFNRQRGAMDTRRVLRRASNGQSLVFFPEGTFSRQPGLLRFHTGAFTTAVRARCPIVPVLIRGARQVLPPSRLIPRSGGIEVEILPALNAAAGDSNAAVHLRDEARRLMMERLGEPGVFSEDT